MKNKKFKTKTFELFGQKFDLVGVQIDVFEALQLSPKTVVQIAQATNLKQRTIGSCLDKLFDRNIVFAAELLFLPKVRRQKVWRVGSESGEPIKPDDRVGPGPKPVDKEIEAEMRELNRKKAVAEDSIKNLLKQQNTKFGWLVANAGAKELPKAMGAQNKY